VTVNVAGNRVVRSASSQNAAAEEDAFRFIMAAKSTSLHSTQTPRFKGDPQAVALSVEAV
jgi:hypothetical protein